MPNDLSVRSHSFCAFFTCRWQRWARFEPLRRKQSIPLPSATDLVTAILSTFFPTITYRQRDVANVIRQRNVSKKIDTLRLLFVLFRTIYGLGDIIIWAKITFKNFYKTFSSCHVQQQWTPLFYVVFKRRSLYIQK